MRKVVNEKTLELNVCAELLTLVRRNSPSAYWYGMSNWQEDELGVDEFIRSSRGRLTYLQFKSPHRLRQQGLSVFGLNSEQFKNLSKLSRNRPHSTYYALPDLTDLRDLRAASPNLANVTCFVDLEGMKGFTWYAQRKKILYVSLDAARNEIVLHGQKRRVSAPCAGLAPFAASLRDGPGNADTFDDEVTILVESLRNFRRPVIPAY